ncbi:hypothetical protein L596_011017 [Steinernema carpocapsae]|uniref:Uncharacterized protein n=1 Tax=Steinernema carpocapsae TaxID=34508 RepID=A0A4U5NT18_STECR|nr:hypothetical protein L596_011017 [Steinernema carpocapsae]
MKLRDSLVNMLGEFVALNKTPDFKLNSSSVQFLSDRVAEESGSHRNSLNIFIGNDVDYCGPVHSRTHSTTSVYSPVCRDPNYFSGRRQSEPAVYAFPDSHYRKISSDRVSTGSGQRTTSVISESEEEHSHESQASSRRGSQTFFGSIAAYSNHLGPLNTRL